MSDPIYKGKIIFDHVIANTKVSDIVFGAKEKVDIFIYGNLGGGSIVIRFKHIGDTNYIAIKEYTELPVIDGNNVVTNRFSFTNPAGLFEVELKNATTPNIFLSFD